MPAMIPFDGETGEMAHGFLSRSLWGSVLAEATRPAEMEPLPPVNAKGGRTIPPEGWKSTYAIEVLPTMCNPMGNLHGGAAATIVDTVTSASLAVLATDSFWGLPMLAGVTITLDMQYYNAAPEGTKMKLIVTVEHMGGSLANVRGDLVDWETGKRFASGTHVKTWRPLAGAKYAAAKAERKAKL